MDKSLIIKLILFYSQIYHVDPKISLSVAEIESKMNPNAISETGDYGIFQLNINSFPQLNEEQLLNPAINISTGIKYLAQMKKQCNYKRNNEWLVCWNLGKRGARKIKQPAKY